MKKNNIIRYCMVILAILYAMPQAEAQVSSASQENRQSTNESLNAVAIDSSAIAIEEVERCYRCSIAAFRAELHNGLYFSPSLRLTKHLHPYLTMGLTLSYTIDEPRKVFVSPAAGAGLRLYFNPTKTWTGFIDARYAGIFIVDNKVTIHSVSVIGGASVKNFDFGAGVLVTTYEGGTAPNLSFSIGYNIR